MYTVRSFPFIKHNRQYTCIVWLCNTVTNGAALTEWAVSERIIHRLPTINTMCYTTDTQWSSTNMAVSTRSLYKPNIATDKHAVCYLTLSEGDCSTRHERMRPSFLGEKWIVRFKKHAKTSTTALRCCQTSRREKFDTIYLLFSRSMATSYFARLFAPRALRADRYRSFLPDNVGDFGEERLLSDSWSPAARHRSRALHCTLTASSAWIKMGVCRSPAWACP